MLINRRIEPFSSQTLLRNPGNLESRFSSTCVMVPGSTSTVSAPCVYFRRGVGITTLSDIVNTSKDFFKCFEFGFYYLRRCKIQGVEGLEAIPGYCQDDKFIRL